MNVVWLVLLALSLIGCRPGNHVVKSAEVVDSAFSMDTLLARFRRDLPAPPSLAGAGSRDSLIQGIVQALRSNDTTAFERLAVSRAEWAWLYFPTDTISKPPYELPPALAWFQLQEANRKGVFRALRKLGGKPLQYQGYRCGREPTVEGPNRVWVACEVMLGIDKEQAAPVRLFSSILERDGRFAVLSYHNDF